MSSYNQPLGGPEGDVNNIVGVASLNSEAEEEHHDIDSWTSRWNQSIVDGEIPQSIHDDATGDLDPLTGGATYSIPITFPPNMEGSHAYAASPWPYSSIPHPQPALYASSLPPLVGLSSGLHSNNGGARVSQHFQSDPTAVTTFSSAYHRKDISLLEQISAEQQEYITSLEQSTFTPGGSTRPTQENQIHWPAEAGTSSSSTSLLHSSDATSMTHAISASPAGGSSTRVVGSYTRAVRESMHNNPAYHSACARVVDIMAQFKLPLEVGDTHPVVPGSTRLQVTEMLNTFINAQTDDIKGWLNSGRADEVTSDDIMKAAVSRRSSGVRVYMHYCYWCDIWLTTKGNLANHIRSHLGFHISFCENCNFSAVTPTLPSRHRGRCKGGRRVSGW